ncbi:MAG: S8 family serine peptidase, partial [Hominilimicola sp.]
LKNGAMVMKRFRYIFFAALLAMMWLGINVYADEYDGLDFDYGSVLVQLKPQITDAVSMCSDPFEELNISDAKCIFGDDASSISLFSDKTEPIIYVLDLENPSRENVIDTIEKLKAMPNIEYAEPNYNVYEFSEPNDTYYQNGKQAVLDLIGAKKLWDFDIDCSDVTVGVMDSGIQTNHEDLIDNIWVNTGEIVGDGIDNDGNGYIDDIYGWNCGDSNGDVSYVSNHGVHVAGIVSAVTDNSKGVASVARNAKIASIKIFNSSGKSTLSYIIEGINYAKKNDINIINCSFGGAGWGSTSVSIVKSAIEAVPDIFFVIAAGNIATSTPQPDNDQTAVYPSQLTKDLDNVISVANTTSSDELSSTSHYGATSVDIAAPGTVIYSTIPTSSYGTMSGTSMATPMVASAVAVMRAVNPNISAKEIKETLCSSSDKLSALTGKVISGGRLNAYNAVKAIMPTATPTATPTTVPTPTATPTATPTTVPTPTATSMAMPTTVPTATPSPTATPTVKPTSTPTIVPIVTPSPTAMPTTVPMPTVTSSPTATPTATPTAAPTVTPMPTVLTNNKIECEIKDNKLIVSLNFEEDDELMYVAFRKGNELKKIVTPDIHNMTAEVDLSDTEYDSIDVYVWNGNMKPYAEVKQIEK